MGQKSYQRNKHMSITWKIFRTLLKMNKERTQTNEPEDKKADDNAKGLTSKKDIDRLCVSRKEGGRGLVSIEDCVDASTWSLKDYIEKNKQRPVRALATQGQTEQQKLGTEIVVFWSSTRPNMPFQNDAPEGSDPFQWPVIERDRVGGFGWWNGTR